MAEIEFTKDNLRRLIKKARYYLIPLLATVAVHILKVSYPTVLLDNAPFVLLLGVLIFSTWFSGLTGTFISLVVSLLFLRISVLDNTPILNSQLLVFAIEGTVIGVFTNMNLNKIFNDERQNHKLLAAQHQLEKLVAEKEQLAGDVLEQSLNLDRRKDEFIGITSHELKTPLTTIKAYAQIIQKRLLLKQDTESVELLEKLENQANNLNRLVTELLDLSLIKNNKQLITKELVDFDAFVLATIESLRVTYPAVRIDYTGNTGTIVKLDKTRIEEVITNLIKNAVRYSPKSNLLITGTTREGKNKVRFTVQDFGNGIDPVDKDKIFDLFYSIDQPGSGRKYSLGLGLYISKEIIRLHKGEIWFTSKPGKGSSFYFVLPCEII